jgi:hypothetical protein
MIFQSRARHNDGANSSHCLLVALSAILLLLTGCTPAAAFAPSALRSSTSAITPVPVRPSTATPLPLGKRSIYVVDPQDGDLISEVLVINPDARRIVTTIASRYAPEIAISPDGQKLYIVDSYSTRVIRGDHHDVVSVYAASTGQLLFDDMEIPNRLIYKLFPDGHPFMFLSRDGKRLFVGKYGSSDIHELRMTVLDAETFKTLAEYARPDCDLLPLLSGELLCIGSAKGHSGLVTRGLPGCCRRAVRGSYLFALFRSGGSSESYVRGLVSFFKSSCREPGSIRSARP